MYDHLTGSTLLPLLRSLPLILVPKSRGMSYFSFFTWETRTTEQQACCSLIQISCVKIFQVTSPRQFSNAELSFGPFYQEPLLLLPPNLPSSCSLAPPFRGQLYPPTKQTNTKERYKKGKDQQTIF